MELSELIDKVHKLVEAREMAIISQAKTAKRIGVSARTYAEYSKNNQIMGMQ